MRKALVILSGGQDSVTCLHWALDRYEAVEAITFNYGQKHSVELDCAKQQCKKHNVKQTIVDISFLGTIVESALTSAQDVNEIKDNGLPASFVPNRNQLFYTLAHAYAQKIGFDTLVGGMCETDYSGYPDCRREFLDKLELTTNKGSGALIHIETPLMHLNKAQTFALAEELGVLQEVVLNSHTCYNGDHTNLHYWGYGCGKCPACELRRKGFEEFIESI